MKLKDVKTLMAQGAKEQSVKVENVSFSTSCITFFLEDEILQGEGKKDYYSVDYDEVGILLSSNLLLEERFQGTLVDADKPLLKRWLKGSTLNLLTIIVSPGKEFISLRKRNTSSSVNNGSSPIACNWIKSIILTKENMNKVQLSIEKLEEAEEEAALKARLNG